MKIDELRRVCVIGAGLMGRQIALNAAHHGFAVRLWDASAEQLRAAERWTDEYIASRIEKRRWTADEAAAARSRLSFAADLAGAAADAAHGDEPQACPGMEGRLQRPVYRMA